MLGRRIDGEICDLSHGRGAQDLQEYDRPTQGPQQEGTLHPDPALGRRQRARLDGPSVATALRCRLQTVENLRRYCLLEGLELALCGEQRSPPPVLKRVAGEHEARVIALRLSAPPPVIGTWALRLLARHVVVLGIVNAIRHGAVQTLRTTASRGVARGPR